MLVPTWSRHVGTDDDVVVGDGVFLGDGSGVVGAALGDASVGVRDVGGLDGAGVGAEGAIVGDLVGPGDGHAEGSGVGFLVGVGVGELVGSSVALAMGTIMQVQITTILVTPCMAVGKFPLCNG